MTDAKPAATCTSRAGISSNILRASAARRVERDDYVARVDGRTPESSSAELEALVRSLPLRQRTMRLYNRRVSAAEGVEEEGGAGGQVVAEPRGRRGAACRRAGVRRGGYRRRGRGRRRRRIGGGGGRARGGGSGNRRHRRCFTCSRSEEHTSELQSPECISYAVFCLRSEERRVGKECQSVCRSRWSPYH